MMRRLVQPMDFDVQAMKRLLDQALAHSKTEVRKTETHSNNAGVVPSLALAMSIIKLKEKV